MKKKFNKDNNQKLGPSQRQLRVGEAIKKTLSEIFVRGHMFRGELAGISVTVSEVRVTPDLKNAMAFVMPLGGFKAEQVLKYLNENTNEIRYWVTQKIEMKFSPKIHFKLDNTYEYAEKIESLLIKAEVKKPPAKDETE